MLKHCFERALCKVEKCTSGTATLRKDQELEGKEIIIEQNRFYQFYRQLFLEAVKQKRWSVF